MDIILLFFICLLYISFFLRRSINVCILLVNRVHWFTEESFSNVHVIFTLSSIKGIKAIYYKPHISVHITDFPSKPLSTGLDTLYHSCIFYFFPLLELICYMHIIIIMWHTHQQHMNSKWSTSKVGLEYTCYGCCYRLIKAHNKDRFSFKNIPYILCLLNRIELLAIVFYFFLKS